MKRYLALAVVIFFAVEAALLGAVEFYRWRTRVALEDAQKQIYIDTEVKRRLEQRRMELDQ